MQSESRESVGQKLIDGRIDWSFLLGGIVGIALDRIVNFAPVNRHLAWGFNAQPNFVATNFHHNDRDVVVDDDAFVFFPREYQHKTSLP